MKHTSQHNSKPTIGNVAIVIPPYKNPWDVAPQTRPLRFVAVFVPLAKKVFIITGNFRADIPYDNVTLINVKAPIAKTPKESLISRGFRFLSAQFALPGAIIRLFLRVGGNLDIVFFFGGGSFVIPVLISKLLRRKTNLVLRGSLEKETQIQKNIFSKLLTFLQRVSMALSDKIIVYSRDIVSQWNLGKYQNKILIAPYLFIDFNEFRVERPLDERDNIVGYVGRFSPEKGIGNLVEAVSEIREASPDVRFWIVGDGQLRDEIEQYVKKNNLDDKVRLVGEVSRNEIPGYLNQLKLLVIPSYSEGLPNTILEAMACGTPVLATPVGSIPDVITDGETGFIMEDNSPECIARSVIRALNHPNIEKIAHNAHAVVERKYTYQAAVERYRDILANLNEKR